MGNFNKNKYQVNNSSMSSKKGHSFFSGLGCNIIRSKKKKCQQHYKSKSLNFDESNDSNIYVNAQNKIGTEDDIQDSLTKTTNSFVNLNANLRQNDSNNTLVGVNVDKQSSESSDRISSNSKPANYDNNYKAPKLNNYSRLSENSLNSDDLMLGTDVNLDHADDDVCKDYGASEKADVFIFNIGEAVKESDKSIKTEDKFVLHNSLEAGIDESEKNDVVSFDSSRESSTSMQRKIFGKSYSLRPHSFSSPLRPNPRDPKKRCSNLSTVDSVDLAWTWISASETANLSQDVSNLKLMLLKMRRLLDDTGSDVFNSSFRVENPCNPTASNVFSEPNTPISNDIMTTSFHFDADMPQTRQWENMTREMLIQELYDMHRQNADLQYQLKEKKRIIEILQDQQQNYKNYPRRLHSTSSRGEISNRRIIRSSTFETASTLINTTFSQDGDLSLASSHDIKETRRECEPITPQ